MAPKGTQAEIRAKLDELRHLVRDRRGTHSARRGTTFVKSLRQSLPADERKWYMFVRKFVRKKAASTQEQAEHLQHTFV